jgi:hypothetical protein
LPCREAIVRSPEFLIVRLASPTIRQARRSALHPPGSAEQTLQWNSGALRGAEPLLPRPPRPRPTAGPLRTLERSSGGDYSPSLRLLRCGRCQGKRCR